jgi:CsoR family transcriptional regulator, copper-sensing transcriptional repressor
MTGSAMGQATPEQLVTRLRRIEGQVRGLQHMIERGDRCIDVLTQVAAIRAALTAVGRHLVDCEIRRAVDAGTDGADNLVADVLVAVELLSDR